MFGPGYGECICVHLGAGEWAVIDSCLDPETQQPAALHYLAELGLSAAEAVRLVVITHWDDDHIRGISRTVEECEKAIVCCSAVFANKEAAQFVMAQESARSALGSGLDELREVLRISHRRGSQILWAKENVPLYPHPPGQSPIVVALSPSDDAFERCLLELTETATGLRGAVPRRYTAPEGPNGASVATSISAGRICLLLGADLEASANPEAGWEAVIAHAKPARNASIVKVPHHGSRSAHHDGMWSELVEESPIAIITPHVKGANTLPRDEDLTRLKSLTGSLFLTSEPEYDRVRKGREVERLLSRSLHSEPVRHLRGWGHVRARLPLKGSDSSWRVELEGDARRVN